MKVGEELQLTLVSISINSLAREKFQSLMKEFQNDPSLGIQLFQLTQVCSIL